MVLQANVTAKGDVKARKASPEFLSSLLRDNGFPDVHVSAPRGFARPLIVGKQITGAQHFE